MLKEGDLVLVLTKMKKTDTEPLLGTFIGMLSDKRVIVLLPDGYIFTGKSYEIMAVTKEDDQND